MKAAELAAPASAVGSAPLVEPMLGLLLAGAAW
jgi:hypothetical protein